MTKHEVGTREEWLAARVELLERESDVTFLAASRDPLARLAAYKLRMGWSFPWVSSLGSDFNVDFAVFTDEGRRTGAGFNFGSPRRASLNVGVTSYTA